VLSCGSGRVAHRAEKKEQAPAKSKADGDIGKITGSARVKVERARLGPSVERRLGENGYCRGKHELKGAAKANGPVTSQPDPLLRAPE
jgi:hypothetical protein